MCVIKARERSSRLRSYEGTKNVLAMDLYHFLRILDFDTRGFYYFMKAVGNEKKIHIPFRKDNIEELSTDFSIYHLRKFHIFT